MWLFICRKKGVKLALTITPFVSTSSLNFLDGVEGGIFISEPSRSLSINAMTHFGNDVKDLVRSTIPALTTYKVFIYNLLMITLRYRSYTGKTKYVKIINTVYLSQIFRIACQWRCLISQTRKPFRGLDID